MISEKNILQSDSEGKNLAGKLPDIQRRCMSEEKKLYQQRFGNKNLTQTKAIIPFPPPALPTPPPSKVTWSAYYIFL